MLSPPKPHKALSSACGLSIVPITAEDPPPISITAHTAASQCACSAVHTGNIHVSRLLSRQAAMENTIIAPHTHNSECALWAMASGRVIRFCGLISEFMGSAGTFFAPSRQKPAVMAAPSQWIPSSSQPSLALPSQPASVPVKNMGLMTPVRQSRHSQPRLFMAWRLPAARCAAAGDPAAKA